MLFIEKTNKEIYIINGLTKANDDDIILISDVDEIPKIDVLILIN